MKGFLITFEGVDGSGKSTQLELAAAALRAQGLDVLTSREPGGTALAEKLRALLLDPALPLNTRTESLLYMAARSEHLDNLLIPALREGKIVLCDRFADSTLVYQGLARGLNAEQLEPLRQLNAYACRGLNPDVTLLFDAEPKALLARRAARGVCDRYENKGLGFQQCLRQGFLALAAADLGRIRILDAAGSRQEVHAAVMRAIAEALPQPHSEV